jgi:hypothetical protein
MGKNHQRKKRRRERQQSEGEGQETTSADARKEGAASLNTVETKSSLDIPSIDTTRQPGSSKKQSTSSKKRKRAKAQEKDSRDLEKDSRDLEKEHEATGKLPLRRLWIESDMHDSKPAGSNLLRSKLVNIRARNTSLCADSKCLGTEADWLGGTS